MSDIDCTSALFAIAMEKAKARSITYACAVHVCATLGVCPELGTELGKPYFVGFHISDWVDGSTLASWTNGQRD